MARKKTAPATEKMAKPARGRAAAVVEHSVVVPIHNEEGSLQNLHAELMAALGGESFEIIFVDDASTDHSLARCQQLSPLQLVQLKKQSGQSAALAAGLAAARGNFIITLDADGQNPPSEIPLLIAEQRRTGADAVCGIRTPRQDPLGKRLASRLARWARRLCLGAEDVQDAGCTLRICRATVLRKIPLRRHGFHRFIPALLRATGAVVLEIPVAHRPRRSGQTKYGLLRILCGAWGLAQVWWATRRLRKNASR